MAFSSNAVRKTSPEFDDQDESSSAATAAAQDAPVLRAVADAPAPHSQYLVKRLFETPEYNLFNHVKFNLVNDQIQKRFSRPPRLFDIGCGLQVAKRYLQCLNQQILYFGADYEAAFRPDAVVDLNEPGALDEPMKWQPDVVMLLDVLEHLHEDINALDQVVAHIRESMPDEAIVVVTVPQWYRLDCLKLPHLHYPEHKIRLTRHEWQALLEHHFDVVESQGVGYLSVLPYLPMASRHYRPDNRLGRLFNHLRSRTFEKRWIKPLDLFLSRTLGRLQPFKSLSNDILFVARKR